jgi:hypothetical protein
MPWLGSGAGSHLCSWAMHLWGFCHDEVGSWFWLLKEKPSGRDWFMFASIHFKLVLPFHFFSSLLFHSPYLEFSLDWFCLPLIVSMKISQCSWELNALTQHPVEVDRLSQIE